MNRRENKMLDILRQVDGFAENGVSLYGVDAELRSVLKGATRPTAPRRDARRESLQSLLVEPSQSGLLSGQ